MPPTRTRTPSSNADRPTTRTGRPLSHAEEDLRLFGQIDGRWRRLSGTLAQRWQLERMAADLGLEVVDPKAGGRG
jgi:hypothetical protein